MPQWWYERDELARSQAANHYSIRVEAIVAVAAERVRAASTPALRTPGPWSTGSMRCPGRS